MVGGSVLDSLAVWPRLILGGGETQGVESKCCPQESTQTKRGNYHDSHPVSNTLWVVNTRDGKIAEAGLSKRAKANVFYFAAWTTHRLPSAHA